MHFHVLTPVGDAVDVEGLAVSKLNNFKKNNSFSVISTTYYFLVFTNKSIFQNLLSFEMFFYL